MTVSFNQWLSLQVNTPGAPFADLAKVWAVTRGRLTRQTVVDRAKEVGIAEAHAGAAWDHYLIATGQTPAAA